MVMDFKKKSANTANKLFFLSGNLWCFLKFRVLVSGTGHRGTDPAFPISTAQASEPGSERAQGGAGGTVTLQMDTFTPKRWDKFGIRAYLASGHT